MDVSREEKKHWRSRDTDALGIETASGLCTIFLSPQKNKIIFFSNLAN